MRKSLIVIRWIVGLLFIFSGLIKANDPLGLSYKMQEFFEVWGLQNLNNYTLAFALVMNVFEVLAGVAVIIGWRMRLFSWLLLRLYTAYTIGIFYKRYSIACINYYSLHQQKKRTACSNVAVSTSAFAVGCY